jgi:hypothetical protein
MTRQSVPFPEIGDDGKGSLGHGQGVTQRGAGLGHVLSRASPLEGEAASALIFHPISKPTVNDYVPFFGVPAPPPTDREIFEKNRNRPHRNFFGEKIRKTECRYLSMWAQNPRGYRYLTKAWVWG